MKAKEINPQEPFNKTILPSHGEGICLLKTSIIGSKKANSPPWYGTWSAWDKVLQ
jgi:hypothetical protein